MAGLASLRGAVCALLSAALLFSITAAHTVLYVSETSGVDVGGCQSTPCFSLPYALLQVNNSQFANGISATVQLDAGVYNISAPLNFALTPINITCAQGPYTCAIDAQGNTGFVSHQLTSPTWYYASTVWSGMSLPITSTISGVRLLNGNSPLGAIQVVGNAAFDLQHSLSLINCPFQNTSAPLLSSTNALTPQMSLQYSGRDPSTEVNLFFFQQNPTSSTMLVVSTGSIAMSDTAYSQGYASSCLLNMVGSSPAAIAVVTLNNVFISQYACTSGIPYINQQQYVSLTISHSAFLDGLIGSSKWLNSGTSGTGWYCSFTMNNVSLINLNGVGLATGSSLMSVTVTYGGFFLLNSVFQNIKTGAGIVKPNGGTIINGAFHVVNSSFTNITSSGTNAVLCMSTTSILTNVTVLVQSSSFVGCASAGPAGAILLSMNSWNFVSNVSVINCTAQTEGGGIYIKTAVHTLIQDSYLQGNSAPYGGGILIDMPGLSSTHLSNVTFVSNVARQGGALYVSAGTGVIGSSLTFLNNEAVAYGGGLWAGSVDRLSFGESVWTGNSAQSGGAIYVDSAVNISSACSSWLLSPTLVGNTARQVGAAIYLSGARPVCDGLTDMCGMNTSSLTAGQLALVTDDPAELYTPNCLFVNNAAASGYGHHFGFEANVLLIIQQSPLIDNRSIPVTLNKEQQEQAAVALLNSSAFQPISSLTLFPGLHFGCVVAALDMRGRVMRFSGGAAPTVSLTLISGAAGSAGAAESSESVVTISGLATFASLKTQVVPGSVLNVQSSSDLPLNGGQLSAAAVTQSCPALYYAVVSGSSYTCVPRPTYVDGDMVVLSISASSVGVAVFVDVIGWWTALVLCEQGIASFQEKRRGQMLLWSGLTSLALSAVGVSTGGLIILGGVSFPALPVGFEAASLIGGILAGLAATQVAVWSLLQVSRQEAIPGTARDADQPLWGLNWALSWALSCPA